SSSAAPVNGRCWAMGTGTIAAQNSTFGRNFATDFFVTFISSPFYDGRIAVGFFWRGADVIGRWRGDEGCREIGPLVRRPAQPGSANSPSAHGDPAAASQNRAGVGRRFRAR